MPTHRLTINLPAEYLTGQNPETLPAQELEEGHALRCLYYCESLFFVVSQLGEMALHDHWRYDREKLYEALGHLGELGRAAAKAANHHLQCAVIEKERENK